MGERERERETIKTPIPSSPPFLFSFFLLD